MGHKVHPMGFRIGVIRDWQAKWYSDKHYAEFLHEDLKLRQAIKSKYTEAGISLVQIDRQANKVSVTLHTARPGIVIGRGGQRVDEMRLYLENIIGKRIQLNIQEIQQPELDAYLVATSISEQMKHRIAYRRAMKQAVTRTIQAGAKGIRISCAGRLGGAEIARRLTIHEGQVPLHTLRADIDYGFTEAHTAMGRVGVKVWIYKGDILPEPKLMEIEEEPVEPTVDISAEASPAAEAEEKPAKPTTAKKAKVTPAIEAEEKPVEPSVDISAEAPPVAEDEEKPVEPTVDMSAEAIPVAEAEEKPIEPTVDMSAEATPVAEAEEKPVEPTVDISIEAETSTSIDKEEKDATTQTGEIPKDS